MVILLVSGRTLRVRPYKNSFTLALFRGRGNRFPVVGWVVNDPGICQCPNRLPALEGPHENCPEIHPAIGFTHTSKSTIKGLPACVFKTNKR